LVLVGEGLGACYAGEDVEDLVVAGRGDLAEEEKFVHFFLMCFVGGVLFVYGSFDVCVMSVVLRCGQNSRPTCYEPYNLTRVFVSFGMSEHSLARRGRVSNQQIVS
jgi:hypothetical protein